MGDVGQQRHLPRRGHKQQVRQWVVSGDLEAVSEQARQHGATRPYRDVMRLAYDREELVRWRALVALGRVAEVQAEAEIDKVREWMRRIMWWMNDESGALLRCGCEAMAEIMIRVPPMRPEYGHLLSFYLDEEPFEAGARWAIARLATVEPQLLADATDKLMATLDAPDPTWRAHGAMALAALGALDDDSPKVMILRRDDRPVSVFDAERLTLDSRTVAQVVETLVKQAQDTA